MPTVTIDPYENFTREDLIRIIKQDQLHLEGMSERYRALLAQLVQERKRWVTDFQAFMQRIENPNHYAADAERMVQWLLDLNHALRPVLGIGFKKYGMRDLLYDTKAKEKEVAVARIMVEVLDYFDWDDE